MGKENRRKERIGNLKESPYSGRPVFTDDKNYTVKPCRGIFACLDLPYEDKEEKHYFSVSEGWCYDKEFNLYYSYRQAFKYRLRKLLGLPVKSDNMRDLVTWRRRKA